MTSHPITSGGYIKAALCNFHVLPEIQTHVHRTSADIFTTELIEHVFLHRREIEFWPSCSTACLPVGQSQTLAFLNRRAGRPNATTTIVVITTSYIVLTYSTIQIGQNIILITKKVT